MRGIAEDYPLPPEADDNLFTLTIVLGVAVGVLVEAILVWAAAAHTRIATSGA